jgi:phenylpyruvate tautomerase PptA (4-oxalocrotonate tautomerase family)
VLVLHAVIGKACAAELKAGLCSAFTYCCAEFLGLPIEQVCVFLTDVPAESASVAGRRGEGVALLHVYLTQRQTDAEKRALAEALAAATVAVVDVPAANVRSIFHGMNQADVGSLSTWKQPPTTAQ